MGIGGFFKGVGRAFSGGSGMQRQVKQIDKAKQAKESAQAAEQTRLAGIEDERLAKFSAGRAADMAAGQARGETLFGNNALGRVDANRSAAVTDILARRQANLAGFTPDEQGAMRDQNMKTILQGQQAGARDLARNQARSGVRGGLASAQQGAFAQQGQGQLADQERQLFLANIAQKRGALDQFEQSQTGAEATDLGKIQYNQGQAAKELLGKLSTEMGYGSLGSADRAAAMQSALGDKTLSGSKEIAEMTKGKK